MFYFYFPFTCVAIGLMTLNAGANTLLLANVAGEFPPGWRDGLDRVDRFQEHRVGKSHFGNPQRTDDVCPSASVRLLEGTALVRTQNALDRPGRALQTATTQPLTLGYVRDAVAVLSSNYLL